MKKKLQKEFIQILNKPKKVVIIPHKNRDGDALGSTLALNFFLNKTGHQSHVVSPNEYPDFLNWLPGQEGILKHTTETDKSVELIKAADLIFTLDFNSLGRVEMSKVPLSPLSLIYVFVCVYCSSCVPRCPIGVEHN